MNNTKSKCNVWLLLQLFCCFVVCFILRKICFCLGHRSTESSLPSVLTVTTLYSISNVQFTTAHDLHLLLEQPTTDDIWCETSQPPQHNVIINTIWLHIKFQFQIYLILTSHCGEKLGGGARWGADRYPPPNNKHISNDISLSGLSHATPVIPSTCTYGFMVTNWLAVVTSCTLVAKVTECMGLSCCRFRSNWKSNQISCSAASTHYHSYKHDQCSEPSTENRPIYRVGHQQNHHLSKTKVRNQAPIIDQLTESSTNHFTIHQT